MFWAGSVATASGRLGSTGNSTVASAGPSDAATGAGARATTYSASGAVVFFFRRRIAMSGGGVAAPPEITSASALAAMIVSARTTPVGTIIQGCWKMKRAAVWIMPPQVGSGGCGPRPMKARPACIMMPTPKKSTNCTMTVVDMLGRTWRKLDDVGRTPSIAAASTNSCFCRFFA